MLLKPEQNTFQTIALNFDGRKFILERRSYRFTSQTEIFFNTQLDKYAQLGPAQLGVTLASRDGLLQS
jgi:hypothetical protein